MGWKTSMIFANSVEEIDLPKLFESMGIYNLQKIDSHSFDYIMNPDDDKIYVGKFNGNTIICMQDIPLESLDERISRAENALSKMFNHADVVTFVLHSVVNLWGYSIIKNGKKVRVRAGSSDGGTMIEYGEVLKEEESLMSQSRLDDQGERFFKIDSFPNEEFSADQVGENFVFNISAKYFGEALDESDDIFETEFDGYTFSKSRPVQKDKIENQKPEDKTNPTKPWWKFW